MARNINVTQNKWACIIQLRGSGGCLYWCCRCLSALAGSLLCILEQMHLLMTSLKEATPSSGWAFLGLIATELSSTLEAWCVFCGVALWIWGKQHNLWGLSVALTAPISLPTGVPSTCLVAARMTDIPSSTLPEILDITAFGSFAALTLMVRHGTWALLNHMP